MAINFKTLRIAAVSLLTAGGLLGACNWPVSSLHSVTVHDTKSGISGVPASIPAGQYTFNFVTTVPGGGLQLARIGSDYSIGQAMKDAAVVFGPPGPAFAAAVHRFYSRLALLGGLGGSGSYSTYLSPGNYVALDTNSNKFEPFKVTFAKALPNYPKPTIQFAGIMGTKNGMDHFEWHIRGEFAKSGVLRFVAANGDDPHFLAMFFLHPGKTEQQCISYQGAPAGAPCDQVVNTGIVSPLNAMTMSYSFPHAGTYIVVCFMPDDTTGMPHAQLGMATKILLH